MISFDSFINKDPNVTYFPDYDSRGEYEGNKDDHKGMTFDGIKALTYDGADYMGMHTKVFAHIGFPENIKEPVPAIVLVHGGGGHPEDIWIKKWNDRGYAAISMDTTGFFPQKPLKHIYESASEGLERKLCEPFYRDGYTVGPHNTEMADSDKPITDQWMYHAVAAVISAHNVLRNDARVDSAKIGICGISWGGVVTSVTIGYDNRFAFAIPIYGSGYMGHGFSRINRIFRRPDVYNWFAEKRFEHVTMPVMWLCWNDDCCFSVNSNSLSYLDTVQNNADTCLSMLHGMGHSHYRGYKPCESYWFADCITNKKDVPRVSACRKDGILTYSCDASVKAARLFYITERMRYIRRDKHGIKNDTFMEQEWQMLDLDPCKASAPLPENAVGSYVEVTLENGIVLTTPYKEV